MSCPAPDRPLQLERYSVKAGAGGECFSIRIYIDALLRLVGIVKRIKKSIFKPMHFFLTTTPTLCLPHSYARVAEVSVFVKSNKAMILNIHFRNLHKG